MRLFDSSGKVIPKKEIRCDFQMEETTVTAVGSLLNGKETVYVNGTKVSAKWSFLPKSSHHFSIGEVVHTVEFDFSKILRKFGFCRLKRAGVTVKTYKVTVSKIESRIKFIALRISFLLLIMGFSFLWTFLNLNTWFLIPPVIILMFLFMRLEIGDIQYELVEDPMQEKEKS